MTRSRFLLPCTLAPTLLLATPVRAEAPVNSAPPATAPAPPSQDIVVTASRQDLIGRAHTASEGTVTRKEVELRPI